jgi:hypothetical protein
MYTVKFWKDAAERLVKTFLQTVLAFLTADGVFSLVDVDAAAVFGAAALAAVISLLTSVVSAPLGSDRDSASLVKDQSV